MPPNLLKSQSPSPSPNGAAAAGSSQASEPASTTSNANGAFVGNAGAAFDPEAAGPPPEPEQDVAADVGWEEERVRQILRAQGVVLHAAIAVDKASGEWIYTDHEARAVAGPLTNILNRYDATRAAAAVGDELALIIGLSGYASRSYLERRRLLAELADEPDRPITGLAPDPTAEEAASWAT